MKVRETSGITSEYTRIEMGKTQNHYVAARAARKKGMIVKKATARWIEQRASFSGKRGGEGRDRRGKGERREGTGGTDGVEKRRREKTTRRIKQLDLSSVINTGLRVVVVMGVRVHLVPHLRHVHVLRIPVLRITVVGVWLGLVRHDVRVQPGVLNTIARSRIDVW